MPSPKSGKAGTAVAPADPKKAEEADVADPGKVEEIKAEQRKTKAGKYGAAKVKPHKPAKDEKEKENKKSWIEIELVGEDKKPIPGEVYRITLPDDAVVEGTLDEKGCARVEGVEPGSCKITFPNLDEEAWEKA